MNELKARRQLIVAVKNLVRSHMGWDNKKAKSWMTTDNPNLGGAAPIYFIMRGRSHKLLAFVENSMSGDTP